MNIQKGVLLKNDMNLSGRITKEHIKKSIDDTYIINFDVTERCNLSCEYCAFGPLYSNKGVRLQRNLNVNYAYRLIDFVFEKFEKKERLYNDRVLFIGFYGGEPLMCMDLIKNIVDYAEAHCKSNIQLRFSLTTNGILLKKHAAYLELKNFRLLISIDGNKEHNRLRLFPSGKESFEVVKSNIDYLQNNYPNYFINQVYFNSVIHQKNSVSEVKDFIYKQYAKIPSTPSVTESGIEECKINDFKEIFREADKFISNNFVYKYIKNYHTTIYSNYSDILVNRKREKTYCPTATCVPFYKKIHMSVDGLIYPCERTSRNFKFGQVSEDEVVINYDEIVQKVNEKYNQIQNLCDVCERKLYCQLCIFTSQELDKPIKCSNFSSVQIDNSVFVEKLENNPELFKYLIEDYYVL